MDDFFYGTGGILEVAMPNQAAARILRRPEVSERVGLARSTLYRMVAENQFPKPVHLTRHSVGWLEHEVEAWLESRARAVPRGQTAGERAV